MDTANKKSPLAINPWPTGNHNATPGKSRRSWFNSTPHKTVPPACDGEGEDLPLLRLTHFTKKVMVCFDTVRTGTSRTRELLVENPCDFPQELFLEKFPHGKGFSVPEERWELDGCELMRLPITWTPKEEGNTREMVTFKCEGAFRLQVILLGTAEDPPKKMGPGRRSTFAVHRKAPLKVTQPKADLRPSRPTMILKAKGQQKPKALGKQPRASTGKTSKENRENQALVGKPLQCDGRKSVSRPVVPAEVDDADEPQIVLSTPSPMSICEKSPGEDFVALDSSLAEINGDGMPTTAEDLLLENLKRQTLSVCTGMSPLLQTAKPFTFPKPALPSSQIAKQVQCSDVDPPRGVNNDESQNDGPKRLSIEAKTTVTKSKAPKDDQPSKPVNLRKNLFVSTEAGEEGSPGRISSPDEFEDSLNEPRFGAFPHDHDEPSQSHNGPNDLSVDIEKPEEAAIPQEIHAEQSLGCDANAGSAVPPPDDIIQSEVSTAEDEPSVDSMIVDNVVPPSDNSTQLDADAFQVHTSIVTSRLTSCKRVSDPKDKVESPPKRARAQEAKGQGAKKQPPRDRTMNRTLALRKAAAAAGKSSASSVGKARGQGRVLGQYKPKGPMKGVPMAKLNLLKPNGTAIPRHPMPFAAKNMFYDERWMEKQERGFTRWLNHVLTPDDCPKDPSCKATKIDAGTLCVESAGKTTIVPAPSKEDLSLRAYTAKRKLNRLRRGACMLFQSEPVVRVLQKLEAEIEKRRIAVRTDRKLHADYGIKQKLLDLFLSYNPLWLRIGLETIYGEILPIQSNTDVVGLSRFVITRLLGNPDIAAQYAHPTVPHLYGPGYEEALSQFTLKKFLVLVFFLDRAKLTRLIDHDPCLFCKDSEFKSSRDVLLHFSREYLRGEGDLTRHLSFMGYSVTHRQTALDEFDFSVTNLATDLRCGVRLARVVELLIHDWTLSSQLRVPAISRLQKIHNVETTLKAVKLDGGGVDARAIVDGHREKTLELLWRIIFQFQIGLLLNEQQIKEEIAFLRKKLRLQKHLDAVSVLSLTDTLTMEETDGRRDSNEPNVYFKSGRLSLLLKWCQAVCSFYGLKVENFTVAFSDGRALCYLVHHYHPSLLPLDRIHQDTTQTQYQRQGETPDSGCDDSFDGTWANVYSPSTNKPGERDKLLANERDNFRVLYDKVSELGGVPGVVKSAEMSNTIPDEKVVITYVSYLCSRLLDLRKETRAARTIQMVWRVYRLRQLRKRRQMQEAAAKTIQRGVRSFLMRQHHKRVLGSIIKLQAMRRRVLACREARKLRQARSEQRRNRAAISLQACVRGFLARRCYQKTLKAIIIQSAVRCYIARRHYLQTRQSVITLQAAARCHRERCSFIQLREAAVVLQRQFRARRSGHQQRALYNLQRSACISLQAAVRGWACRQLYQKKRSAIIVIQAQVRARLLRKRYLQVKSAALTIQRYWRSTLYSRSIREEYLNLRKATITLQLFYRGMVARRYAGYIRRVVKAQAVVRCFLQHKRYLLEKRACVVIQKSLRGFVARKNYKSFRDAAVILQQRFRAQRAGRLQLREYNVKRGAVITLQAWMRGVLARKQQAMEVQSAVHIQAVWKMHRERKRYLSTRAATRCLQKYTRAYLIGKATRCDYLKLRVAAVLIQSHYRAATARRKFLHARASCVAIQSFIRMHIARRRYKEIQGAAVVMQRRFRAKLSRDHQREVYSLQRNAIIRLQAYFRGESVRRQISRQCRAAIRIQATYRAHREQKNYKKLRSATVCLQRYTRAYLIGKWERNNYLNLKLAAVIIQSRYRAVQARRHFLKQKQAAITIQSAVRMQQAHRHYTKLKQAATIIQTRYRAQRLAQAVSFQYQVYRGACITLQAGIRGFLVRQQMSKLHLAAVQIQRSYRSYSARAKYLKLRNAASKLQKHWRATILSRQIRQDFVSLKKAAVILQSAYRGKVGRHIALEHRSARVIQSYYRMHRELQHYQKQKQAAIQIQSALRMQQARCKYTQLRHAAVIIQTRYRAQKMAQAVHFQYQIYRGACITLQAWVRWFLVRQQMRKLHTAATQIQKSFRAYSAHTEYRKLRNATVVMQKHWRAVRLSRRIQQDFVSLKKAAVVLQSAYRGRIGRCIALEHRSARIIQSHYRMHRELQQYRKQKQATIKIQSALRMQQACSKYTQLRQATVIIQTRYRAQKMAQAVHFQYQIYRGACIMLQAWVRGFLVRQQMHKLHTAATQIQKSYRSYSVRSEYCKLRNAAFLLQKHWRAVRLSRKIQQDFVSLKKAAVVLQSAFRGRIGRRIALEHRSARIIQSHYRMHLAWQLFQRKKRASILIQTIVRMHQARSTYAKLRKAVTVIQQRYRATRLAQKTHVWYHIQRGACITIQAYVRGHLVRQHVHRLHTAATDIQRYYRAHHTRTMYLKLKKAASILQKYWRATRKARKQHLEYVALKEATVTIQSAYRGCVGRRIAKEHRAARLIQSYYRMHVAAQRYAKLRAAAVTIQSLYRRHKARMDYLKLVLSALTIQQYFRGHLMARATRNNFLLMRSSVVRIQSAYRGFIQRHAYLALKQAASKTQALYRGKTQRKAFQLMRKAAIVLQERYRAQVLRNQTLKAYKIQRNAAITIQATYKAYSTRKWYIHMKKAVTTLQASYRGHRERTTFLSMKKAVIVLQTRYRAHRLMREAVQDFRAQRKAATAIQAMYRSHTARQNFITLKSAAITIQSFYRGTRRRDAYQMMRRAATVLQTRYRAHLLQREAAKSYHILRGAVITIQAYQRGKLARQYVKQIRAAVKIQSYYRMLTQRRRYRALRNAANKISANFKARTVRREFLLLRSATRVIQVRYRALTAARAQQSKYHMIRRAIITIQAFTRGHQAWKLAQRIRAAVTIQSSYRGYIQHRCYQMMRNSALVLQARARGMIARREFAEMKKYWQAALCIQRHFRSYVLRRTLEAQRQARLAQLEKFSRVVHCHLSAIRIQRCYRKFLMRQAAKAKMQSVITIQRWMRAKLQCRHFLKLRRGMISLQHCVRQHQARRHQAAVRIQAQARVWLARQYVKKMKAAALMLQSVWRGRQVRRSIKDKKVAAARARCIKANKAATEEKKLCNRTASALDYLLQYRHMSGLLDALISLDVVTRLSATCCERLVEGQAVPVIFTLIKSCNRSLPCMEVIKYSVNILLNLTKYAPTAFAVFEEPDSISIILDLMQMYREKGAQIFSKVCMLMGTMCQDPRRAQIILSVSKNKDRLLGIHRLTERKYSMDAKRALIKSRGLNSSTLSSSFLNTSALNLSGMPAATPRRQQRRVQPDWVLGRGKMREITDPLQACRFVMDVLQLK